MTPTLGELLQVYRRHLRTYYATEHTVKYACFCIHEFLDMNAITHAGNIIPAHLIRYQGYLVDPRYGPNTRHIKLGHVQRFLQYLRDRNRILFDPAHCIRIPPRIRTLPKNILTEKEIAAILSMEILRRRRGMRLRTIIELFYGTGIRKHELLNLNLYDIDMVRRTLLVRDGKGKKDRVVPVPRTTLRSVGEYVRTVRAGTGPKDGGLILDRFGRKISMNALELSIAGLRRTVRRRLAIPKHVTCHVFRHSIATHLLERGVDLRYIQAFLGHASLLSTQIYTHIARKHLLRELDRCHPRERMKI